jgi:hypothetical protein
MVKIFGLEILNYPLKEVVSKIQALKGFSFVVTPNLQHVVELNTKPNIRSKYVPIRLALLRLTLKTS